MTKKKKTTYSLGIVILAFVVGLVGGVLTAPRLMPGGDQGRVVNASSRMAALEYIISRYYVDEVDFDSLDALAMGAMLESLDPHSAYLSPEDNDKESELMRGRFEGIGVTLRYVNDTVCVSSVDPSGPARKAGVRPGDRIMKVDSTMVSGCGMTSQPGSVVELIRGPRFSYVNLELQRQGLAKWEKVKVRRDVIRHMSILAAVMMDSRTGYVYIDRFAETTASEFHAALLQLNKEGMKHLVLDLRGNGGGALETAIGVADELLPKGDMIVYTEGTHSPRRNVYATKGGLFEEGELTVLVNEFSASASEVVAGAIQDNDRGVVAGRRTVGKGLVQRGIDLPDGDAVMLTVARYYTPSGRCIQRPYDKGSDAYYMDYLTRIFSDVRKADSLYNAGLDTTQSFLTKKGRKVYGGGGIQPDIILPYLVDTNWVYFNNLINEQVLEQVLFDQLLHHYDELMARYPDADAFVKGYRVDETTWKKILNCADAKGIHRQQGCINKYGENIRARYKALMALSLYGDNAYYRISLPFDTEVQRAVKRRAAGVKANGKTASANRPTNARTK